MARRDLRVLKGRGLWAVASKRSEDAINHVDPYAPRLDLRAVNSLDNEIQNDARARVAL